MTDEQFNQLMSLAERLMAKQFTITSAADWPILVIVMGVLFAVIAFMWIDLRNIIKDNRSEWKGELRKLEKTTDSEKERLWTALKDCQNECCPRGKE